MTRLGYSDPLHRVLPVLRGLVRGPGDSMRGRPRSPSCIVAHRGAPRECPENTLIAFRRALELGADAVEADLCVTRDGHFVLWHDADPDAKVALSRQLGAEKLFVVPEVPSPGSPWRRPVRELALADMREHHRYRRRTDPRARSRVEAARPEWAFDTLEDLFGMIENAEPLRHLYLDMKLADSEAGAALDLVNAIRDRFGTTSRPAAPTFHLLTTQREIATALLGAVPPAEDARIRCYPDFELPGAASISRRLGARNVSLGGRNRLWRGLVQEIEDVVAEKRAGNVDRIVAWTFNDPRRIRELEARGVDAILTDDVPLMRGLQEP